MLDPPMDTRELSEEEIIDRNQKRRVLRTVDQTRTKRKKEGGRSDGNWHSPDKRSDPTVCFKCKRKLRPTNNFMCRCGEMFCSVHRFYDQHGCSFDMKGLCVRRLREENQQVVNKKISEF